MTEYAEVIRRLEAGEVIDPVGAMVPAGRAVLQEGVEQRVAHARQVTPDHGDERVERPPPTKE